MPRAQSSGMFQGYNIMYQLYLINYYMIYTYKRYERHIIYKIDHIELTNDTQNLEYVYTYIIILYIVYIFRSFSNTLSVPTE